jgi:hypothetical protein
MADRNDIVSHSGKAEGHRAAEPAQAARNYCDALFHQIPRKLKTRCSIDRCDRI